MKWIGRMQIGLVWLRRCLLEYTFDGFVISSTLCHCILFRYSVLCCTVVYCILCCTVLLFIVFCIVLYCSLLYSFPSPLFPVSSDRLVLQSLHLEDGSVTISTVFLTFWLSYRWMDIHLCNIRLFHCQFISKTFWVMFFYVSEDTQDKSLYLFL